MKLRIQDNTVRFRLLPQEITCLYNTGSLSCSLPCGTPLNNSILNYSIIITGEHSSSSFTLTPGVIAVYMCRTDLIQLRDTPIEQIIIQSTDVSETDSECRSITIYIEKDRRPAHT